MTSNQDTHSSFATVIRCVPGLVLALVLPLLLTPRASADLVPQGYKRVNSELLFEGIENFPGMTFALYPIDMGAEHAREVKKGADASFYHMAWPDLYALKAGTDISNVAVFRDAAVPRSSVEIRPRQNIPDSTPGHFIRRVYRITGIEGAKLALEQMPDEVFDEAGKLMAVIAVPVASDATKGYIIAGAAILFVLMAAVFSWVRRKRGVVS